MKPRYGAFVIFSCLLFSACQQKKAQAPSAPPPTPVSVVKATQENVPVEIKVVGSAEPAASVQVRSQISGQLLRAHFSEGQNVAKGALLFEIDPRPFQEALKQAEAALLRDEAQLKQAEATLARDQAQARNADVEAGRYQQLAQAGVISKSQQDQVQTNADVSRQSVNATRAAIDSARAALASDRAAIESAKLNLAYTRITAPISGRTGNYLVHPGNIVRASDAALVVINQISPIFVSFSVPEEHVNEIRRLHGARRLQVRVSSQNNASLSAPGTLSVVDNTVDATTGTIRLKATLDNKGGEFWPGQFVNVILSLSSIANATVVPAEAVQNGAKGQFVYVVKANNTVEPRIVTVGRSWEQKTVIEGGVQPGETVVTDGHMRLFPGAPIRAVDPAKLNVSSL